MAVFTIISKQLPPDCKALLYTLDITRGSSGIELKGVQINLNSSYINGDNEETVPLTDVGGSIDFVGTADPIGLPENFVPAKMIINSYSFFPGTGASIVSHSLEDNLGNALTLPQTINLTLDSTTIEAVLKINTLTTGTTESYFEIHTNIENAAGDVSLSKTLVITLANAS